MQSISFKEVVKLLFFFDGWDCAELMYYIWPRNLDFIYQMPITVKAKFKEVCEDKDFKIDVDLKIGGFFG